MSDWRVDKVFETSAGAVAAGRAGDGPDLVLVHGWPWSSFSWSRIIPALTGRFRVHWYDMPGYGRSEKRADQATSLDVQGEIFAEMLAHWRLTRPLVVAHDIGGATTLRAHLLLGCDYERYILMNVVAMRPWGSEFFDHMGRHVEAFQGLPPPIHKALAQAYIKTALVNTLSDDDLTELTKPWLDEDGAASFYRQFAQADEKYTAEIEPMYGQIRCATKIIWGEDDPWIPLQRGRSLHELTLNAEFATLPGAGHMPQLETPEAALREITAFLSASQS